MSIKYKGKGRGPIRTRAELRVASDRTHGTDLEWIGDERSINSLFAIYERRQKNQQLRIDRDGPAWKLFVSYDSALPTPPNPFTVVWTVRTELYEKDIWQYPTVAWDAYNWKSGGPSAQAEYRNEIEQTVSNGSNMSVELSSRPVAQTVYQNLCLGITGWQEGTIAVRRVKTAPLEFAFDRNVLNGKLIYPAENLSIPEGGIILDLFEMGQRVARPGFAWGWRMRSQEFTVSGVVATETIEMVFAQWTLFVYRTTNATVPL